MRPARLVVNSLRYYWRTNVAVVLGVATAVAVLAGALLVGDSVRGSLQDLVLQRLGRTDQVLASVTFFPERLGERLRAHQEFGSIFNALSPLVIVQGFVTEQESGRRAAQVRVYGVDDRFWRFHGVAQLSGPENRDALVSPALASEIGAQIGRAILVRVQRPSEIPLESLHSRKDSLGQTLRLTVRAVAPREALGEFSLEAQQSDVRAVFVSLSRLQQELDVPAQVNTLLFSARPGALSVLNTLESLIRSEAQLEDLGLTLRTIDRPRAVILGSRAGLLADNQARVALEALDGASLRGQPVFTYLANRMRLGEREIPYSLVTATELRSVLPSLASTSDGPQPPILLNAWAASELHAAIGDTLLMEYYVWEDQGQLATRTTEFRVAGIVPTDAGDRDLVPAYPGISDSPTLTDWDPPFPIDLRRIRPVDEAYWKTYRTTPKAFIALEDGQRLWRSRFGAMTSIRIVGQPDQSSQDTLRQYAPRLRARIDPLAAGLAVRDARAEALASSRGATDFGAYFVYFSFFLVVSALLLAALFFKLGVEQRAREVGLLRAMGFGPSAVIWLFIEEGLVLSILGSAIGVLGALGYASLMMAGLRSWWVDAVGTKALTLHVSQMSLVVGALGGVAAAVACIWWTLRSLRHISERSLLMGQLASEASRPKAGAVRRFISASGVLAGLGFVLIIAAVAGTLDGTGAFFGAGTALLFAALCLMAAMLRKPGREPVAGHGWRPLSWLGFRNTTYRPGRSVLSMAVIASATFILISVDAFRRDGPLDTSDLHSGTGGYALLVETLLPVVHDPNSRNGRNALNLFDLQSVTLEPFRLLPGDDASCLNLYVPRNPRILAPRPSFLAAGRFGFQDSLASTDAERANPWLLLDRQEPDGSVPVVADANSMTYVLHVRLGDEIVMTRGDRPIRLRLVAALRDSIFQGELLMSQANFVRLFPEYEGYRLMLVDAAPDKADAVAATIESALTDFGADAISTADRLAAFHKVENTYLSTFQTLGGLGLLLGTVGLATVLFRNVLERRRELALLGAVGFKRRHFLFMTMAENLLLLAAGLLAGAICAGLAIAPAALERGGRIPFTSAGGLLVGAVLVSGLLSSVIATRVATRAPLLDSLRSE